MSSPTPVIQVPHLALLISEGRLEVAPTPMSEAFAGFIEGNHPFVPVTGYHLDWSRIPESQTLQCDGADATEVADFLYASTLSRHRWTALWYRRGEPCLIGKFYFVAYRIAELLPAAGAHYLFGVDGEPGAWEPRFPDFAEVYGTSWLAAFPRPEPGIWSRKIPKGTI